MNSETLVIFKSFSRYFESLSDRECSICKDKGSSNLNYPVNILFEFNEI